MGGKPLERKRVLNWVRCPKIEVRVINWVGRLVVRDLEEFCRDSPRTPFFEAHRAKRDPRQQRDEQVRRRQHEHVFLDPAVDIVKDVGCDLLARSVVLSAALLLLLAQVYDVRTHRAVC